MCVELTSKLEHKLRRTICAFLPPAVATKLYSSSRKYFLKSFFKQKPAKVIVPHNLSRTLWGIEFRSPILNAAGMFKNGEAYELVSAQGAGGYLAGTTTAHPRLGNTPQAFIPYPSSGSASNWLGLPNDSSKTVAERLSKIKKQVGCPIGVSLSASPEIENQTQKLEELVLDLKCYQDANVDFIEINESCPNTEGTVTENAFKERVKYISKNFLNNSRQATPTLILKLSNDTDVSQVPEIIDLLVKQGFSGVNFGNTSTDYQSLRKNIAEPEKKLFDYFTSTYGGGVSGKVIRERSLKLVKAARSALKTINTEKEFHIIQTGGVTTIADIQESLAAGASLVQWYTGYFENFGKHGNNLYSEIYRNLLCSGQNLV